MKKLARLKNKIRSVIESVPLLKHAVRKLQSLRHSPETLVLRPPTDRESILIENLRARIINLPEPVIGLSDAGNEWSRNRLRLRSLILQEDPRSFLHWDVIRQTMFVGNVEYVAAELFFLQKSGLWDRYQQGIRETDFGCPEFSWTYPKSSPNLIHHAYTIGCFEKVSGKSVNEFKTVFEFGGGYGSMCRLFHQLGFQGKYIIFDFPDLSALQSYYLTSIGLKVKSIESFSHEMSGVFCLSTPDAYKKFMKSGQDACFLGTWSVSETPEAVRGDLFAFLPSFDHYIIAFQERYNELNNVHFFQKFSEARPGLHWYQTPIPHLPGNHYCFGFS
ncbi:MAG: hypothetical protein HQM09_17795 [Candidatus Riflebacteria bacterium]|nr:hypothetical protein [Candidatus Riflebacteria bacterium]